jgi:aspartokinase/homoserine dehydrogenase 1
VYVRNIFNPSFKGTVIEGRCKTIKDVVDDGITRNWRAKSGVIPIKGITSVDKTALVTLEGASDLGGANIAERVMGAMDDAGVNVLIIIQASSESSITLAVPQNQGKLAIAALEDAFELELARSTIGSVSLSEGMSIVAIVGENMEMTSGVAATFMNALARAHVNLRLIAQGSSERQIAVVVKSSDTSRALRAAHMAFTLSETVASVALLGSRGYIGKALCKQLLSQQEKLKKILGIGIAVNVAATSSLMAVSKDSRGLDLTHLNQTLHSGDAMEFHLEKFSSVVESDLNPLRIIVDCTNSEAVAEYYERWLKKGISIISHGRKVGAGPIERYRRVCEIQRLNSVSLCLDTSIGSALPVISTMHDLFDTGDTIKSISGHLSGTFAYALGDFSDEIPFSEAVRMALKQDVPELDLRVDLSGQDTAEKVVTLARQAGLEVSLDDVEVENLLPDFMRSKSYNKEKLDAELLADIQKNMDSPMNDRRLAAERENRKLRYKFHIDLESGKCKCWLDAVPQSDPLYRLKSNEYLVSFDTKRYEKSPLTMKGAAAGPDLTAAGIFADLLRLTRTFASNKN